MKNPFETGFYQEIMSEFLALQPPEKALAILLDAFDPAVQTEPTTTADALHRVTAVPITTPFSLPAFPRSTVDGYAVRAADTHGASPSLPAYLTLVGEVPMGSVPAFTVRPGACALIHTGGMLPPGTDAVVMIEYTQQIATSQTEIEILKAAGVGDSVLQIGEDVQAGERVIEPGVRIRAAEIGGLMALGFDQVTVAQRPRIAILSSGDELITPGRPILPGQIYDINSYTLRTLITQTGGIPVNYPIIPDRIDAFRATAQQALAENDMVIFTAGSSVSVRDLTAQTINELGAPGILVHGVNVRPGKPTILAICGDKPVIGLPGNPVSALVIARLFVVPVIERLLGVQKTPIRPTITAPLTINLASQSGREDWVAVRVTKEGAAEPVFGKSNLIFTLAHADGLIRIHPDANGIAAGSAVQVHLL